MTISAIKWKHQIITHVIRGLWTLTAGFWQPLSSNETTFQGWSYDLWLWQGHSSFQLCLLDAEYIAPLSLAHPPSHFAWGSFAESELYIDAHYIIISLRAIYWEQLEVLLSLSIDGRRTLTFFPYINFGMKMNNLRGSDSKLPVYNLAQFLERLALLNIKLMYTAFTGLPAVCRHGRSLWSAFSGCRLRYFVMTRWWIAHWQALLDLKRSMILPIGGPILRGVEAYWKSVATAVRGGSLRCCLEREHHV